MNRPELEAALLGALLVTRQYRANASRLDETMFSSKRTKALYQAASKLSGLGCDDTLENYITNVANYMRDEGFPASATGGALHAYEACAPGTTVDFLITELKRAVESELAARRERLRAQAEQLVAEEQVEEQETGT